MERFHGIVGLDKGKWGFGSWHERCLDPNMSFVMTCPLWAIPFRPIGDFDEKNNDDSCSCGFGAG